MKILIVIPYFAPAWAYGGPPKLMSEAASRLAANQDKDQSAQCIAC